MSRLEITPAGPVQGSIRPPGSKSITNRALICAALADGSSLLRGALDSEDTRVMLAALSQLGLGCRVADEGRTVEIVGGCGQLPVRQADLFVANSGTTVRFLTAMLSTCNGEYQLDGVPRMRQRPIEHLLAAIRQLGGNAQGTNDCPPVVIGPPKLVGGTARIRGDISSQYLSGLLMAAPNAQQPVTIHVEGPLVSAPYVDMTLQVMSSFGVTVDRDHELRTFHIPKATYRPALYDVEPDASAASYFWAAAAVSGGEVTVNGLSADALQGDVGFCDCLQRMGCEVQYGSQSITVTGDQLRGITVDMNGISDTVQTLAVVALFAEGPTTITNVAHIRHKETDRIGDLANELRRLGAKVDEFDDGLTIQPQKLHPADIETYNDHRMAMSFALAGLRVPGVVILDPQCTEKTYPAFFHDLAQLRAEQ